MTISVSTNSVTWLGNGATTVFSYTFAMPAASYATLLYTDASGVQTTVAAANYTLTGCGQPTAGGGPQGGTVTYAPSGSPIAVGTTLTLIRTVPNTQPDSFTNQGGLWPLVVEASDDNLEMQIQQLANGLSRALVVNPADAAPPPLPPAAARANAFLAFDAQGNPVTVAAVTGTVPVSPAMQPVLAAATTLIAAQTMGVIPVVANVAALRAMTAVVSVVWLSGYYSLADGGEGMFQIGGNSSDNGGTIINAASGFSYFREFGSSDISLKWFGCKGDLSADCSAQILAAVTFAAGRMIHAPVGEYRVNTTVSYTGIVNMRGDGNGCGPGPASISNTGCTQFVIYNTTGGLFAITSNQPSTFRDFQVNVAVANRPQGAGGIGIQVSGPIGSTNCNSQFINLGFSNVGVAIRLFRSANPLIDHCYADSWGSAAFYIDTSAAIEGSGGTIRSNFLIGPAGTVGQGPCIYSEVGYIKIHDNTMTGGAGGINIVVKNNPAGSIKIHDNHIEDGTLYGIEIASGDGSLMSMVQINDNEFSNVAFGASYIASVVVLDYGAAYVDEIHVVSNVMRNSVAAGSSMINIGSGLAVTVADNIIENLGGAMAAAIQVSGTYIVNPSQVVNNTLIGSYTALYALATSVVLRDVTTQIPFASLPACNNGSELYISDGRYTTTTNFTVRNGGTGGVAWKNSGVWMTLQP